MRNEKRNYVVVGVFVLAMLVLLLVWIALLAGRTGATDAYSVVYANVAGLKAGTRIHYEGYPVGLIEDIDPIDRDGKRMFRVDVSVQRGWPIPSDSIATITVGIFSAAVIDIVGGRSAELLAPGSEITAREAMDLFSVANEAADKVDAILKGVAERAPDVLENVELVTEDLRQAMAQINGLLASDNVGRVSRILANVERATLDMDQLLADVRATGKNVDVLVGHLDDLLDEESGDLSQAIDDVRHTLAALSSHIDAITANLESATRNANEFSKQIRENPGVLIRGRETE